MAALSDSQRETLLAELGGLRKFCLSLAGNAADADDLLQITVERVLIKGMPGDAHPLKWAYRICRNAWIDEVRSREVRDRYPRQMHELPEQVPSAEQTAGSERQIAQVSAALEQLPLEQSMALTLVAIDGKTYAEAAEILDVPVGTIMSRIARARRNLADIYDPLEEDK
jgi:RNA polymerase sigma-70 factor (ECF subfamily)